MPAGEDAASTRVLGPFDFELWLAGRHTIQGSRPLHRSSVCVCVRPVHVRLCVCVWRLHALAIWITQCADGSRGCPSQLEPVGRLTSFAPPTLCARSHTKLPSHSGLWLCRRASLTQLSLPGKFDKSVSSLIRGLEIVAGTPDTNTPTSL